LASKHTLFGREPTLAPELRGAEKDEAEDGLPPAPDSSNATLPFSRAISSRIAVISDASDARDIAVVDELIFHV
jgi:hypothetical protein